MRQRGWTLVMVCLGTVAVTSGISALYPLLRLLAPAVGSPGYAGLIWSVVVYPLATAATVLSAAKAIDHRSGRAAMVAGLALFAAGMALSAASTDVPLLIAGRAVAGLGTGLVLPAAPLQLSVAFAEGGRLAGVAIWVWRALTGIALAFGPVIGAALAGSTSWRWALAGEGGAGAVAGLLAVVFPPRPRIPLPGPTEAGAARTVAATGAALGAPGVASVLGQPAPPHRARSTGTHLGDVLQAALLAAGLTSLGAGVVTGTMRIWSTSLVVTLLAVGGGLLLAWVPIQLAPGQRTLTLGLLGRRATAGASLASLLLAAVLWGTLLYVTVLLGEQRSPETVALYLLALAGTAWVASEAGRWASLHAPIALLVGVGLAVVGVGLEVLSSVSATDGPNSYLAALIILGAGYGVANPALASSAVGAVEPAQATEAAAFNAAVRQLGLAAGVLAVGSLTIVQARHLLGGAPTATVAAGVLGTGAAPSPAGAVHALVSSFDRTARIGAVTIWVVAVASAALLRATGVRVRAVIPTAPLDERTDPGAGLEAEPAPTHAGTDTTSETGAEPRTEPGTEPEESWGPPATPEVRLPPPAPIDLTLPRSPAPGRALLGRVVNARGEALPGTRLTLVTPEGAEAAQTTSDDNGSFALADLRGGIYTLVAFANARFYRPWATVLALAGEATMAEIKLHAVGSLEGQVRAGREGHALAAHVELRDSDGESVLSLVTEEDGRFVVPEIAEGSYLATAWADGFIPARTDLAVHAGATTTLELRLTGAGHLLGTVASPGGGWVAGALVVVTDAGGRVVATTRTDGAGSFRLAELAEGSYTVVASGFGPAAAAVSVTAGQTAPTDLRLGNGE
jgi:MFS family permease